MQTNFSLAQLADPNIAEAEFDPPALRALRLLPRHLPDLSRARQRARFAARTNLPDQGHAGERQAGVEGGRDAHRPLPLLPLLRDDLPVRRRLHAPRRPGAGADREDLPAAVRRPAGARLLARIAPLSRPLSPGAAAGEARRARSCRCCRRFGRAGARLEAMLQLAPERLPAKTDMTARRELHAGGQAARPRGAAARLRAGGARSGDQRRDGPAPEPLRRRGGLRQGRRLLRLARPPHGARAAGAPAGARQHRRLDRRDRAARGSTPSSSPRRAAARRSRTMAISSAHDRAYAEKAARVSALTLDVTEYLAQARPAGRRARLRPDRRLSLRLLAAARPAHHDAAEGAAEEGRLRGARRPGGPHLLRLGRHLQHPAAGDRGAAARPQGRATSTRSRRT